MFKHCRSLSEIQYNGRSHNRSGLAFEFAAARFSIFRGWMVGLRYDLEWVLVMLRGWRIGAVSIVFVRSDAEVFIGCCGLMCCFGARESKVVEVAVCRGLGGAFGCGWEAHGMPIEGDRAKEMAFFWEKV